MTVLPIELITFIKKNNYEMFFVAILVFCFVNRQTYRLILYLFFIFWYFFLFI